MDLSLANTGIRKPFFLLGKMHPWKIQINIRQNLLLPDFVEGTKEKDKPVLSLIKGS